MILIGLGSNMGNRENNIKIAIYELHRHTDISVDKISSLYETKPVGMVDQPNFLNAVISIETILKPRDLLKVCLHIECQMGRVRNQRWGPRNIDIDILVYHNLLIQDEVLQIPHPRLHKRSFVLIPLQEIADGISIHQGLTPGELLRKMDDLADVMLYKRMNSEFLQL
jgi:2-amino-4-hydroxy-6-hydroxymethyldihydropteridine diphosphokinase